jgi:hypothetical protein
MGLNVSNVDDIGKREGRCLGRFLEEKFGEAVVDDSSAVFLKAKNLHKIISGPSRHGKDRFSLFFDLIHEKAPQLDPEARLEEMSKFKMNQIMNSNQQPILDKQRKNIMRRERTGILPPPDLKGYL